MNTATIHFYRAVEPDFDFPDRGSLTLRLFTLRQLMFS